MTSGGDATDHAGVESTPTSRHADAVTAVPIASATAAVPHTPATPAVPIAPATAVVPLAPATGVVPHAPATPAVPLAPGTTPEPHGPATADIEWGRWAECSTGRSGVDVFRCRRIVFAAALLATCTALAGLSAASGAPVEVGDARATESAVRVAPPRTVRITAGGDILAESEVRAAAARAGDATGARFDFGPLLAPLAAMNADADLAICHMELPIGRPGAHAGNIGRSPFGGNLLIAPYELAAGARAAGFDRCSTASNHSYDAGLPGIVSTLDALDASGMSHTGTARSPDEATPSVINVNGVRVGHVSYTRSSNTVQPAQPWSMNAASTPFRVIADVGALRSGGAELVVVSVHIPHEMERGPIAQDRAFAEAITAGAHIDMIVHHGPHVIQPLEMINGAPVFWSTGNMVSGMGTASSGKYADQRTLDGLLATVVFDQAGDGTWIAFPDAIAICTDPVTRVVHPARAGLAGPLGDRERAVLTACLRRTESVFGPVG